MHQFHENFYQKVITICINQRNPSGQNGVQRQKKKNITLRIFHGIKRQNDVKMENVISWLDFLLRCKNSKNIILCRAF